MLRTKINVNLEIPETVRIMTFKMEKVMAAVNMGAEAIMDLPLTETHSLSAKN